MDRLIERFYRKDLEVYFCELAQLKQFGRLESYISEFQRLSVMVYDILERKRVMLFMEGLIEPLR